jgi:hypothetical protein
MGQARTQLLKQMGTILSEEEFIEFQAALDRLRGDTFFNVKPGPRAISQSGQPKLDLPPK